MIAQAKNMQLSPPRFAIGKMSKCPFDGIVPEEATTRAQTCYTTKRTERDEPRMQSSVRLLWQCLRRFVETFATLITSPQLEGLEVPGTIKKHTSKSRPCLQIESAPLLLSVDKQNCNSKHSDVCIQRTGWPTAGMPVALAALPRFLPKSLARRCPCTRILSDYQGPCSQPLLKQESLASRATWRLSIKTAVLRKSCKTRDIT